MEKMKYSASEMKELKENQMYQNHCWKSLLYMYRNDM